MHNYTIHRGGSACDMSDGKWLYTVFIGYFTMQTDYNNTCPIVTPPWYRPQVTDLGPPTCGMCKPAFFK